MREKRVDRRVECLRLLEVGEMPGALDDRQRRTRNPALQRFRFGHQGHDDE